MLYLLIPIAWLAVAGFVLLLCRASARGDEVVPPQPQQPKPHAVVAGLTLWEDPHDLQVRVHRRVWTRGRPVRGHAGRQRVREHAARSRT